MAASTTRAVIVENSFGLENLRLVERAPTTDPPAPGMVRVRMRAATLNYRDLMMVRGHYDPRQPLPFVPCSDGCGVVEAVGPADAAATSREPGPPGGRPLELGDRVVPAFHQDWLAGPYRPGLERATLGGPLDGTLRDVADFRAAALVHAPERLDDAAAASLGCAGVTAFNALRAGPEPLGADDTVLVIGTGGVSTYAILLAKAAGARVLVTTRSDEKAERARALGADHCFVTPPEEPRGFVPSVREATDKRGVDLVVEVGGAGTLQHSLNAVRTGGTVAVIGVLAGRTGDVDLAPVLMRALRLQGVFTGSAADLAALARTVDEHHLTPVIDGRWPLDESRAAFEALEAGDFVGKLAITF